MAGIEVGLHWTATIIVGLITWGVADGALPALADGYARWEYWAAALAVSVMFLTSVLVHELSHAVVATRAGTRVEGIVLWAFGGVARLRDEARTARDELHIALAGPLASVAIGVTSLAAAAASVATGSPALLAASLAWLGGINLVLAVFNLLPGAPLDGGRVLTAVLWMRTGDAAASRRRAAGAGRVLGQVLIGVGVVQFALGDAGGLWTVAIGWLLTTMARAEVATADLRHLLGGLRVRDVMTSGVHTIPAELSVQAFVSGPWMDARVTWFPVVDPRGQVVGLVSWKLAGAVPRTRWATTMVGDVAATGPASYVVASPDGDLLDVMAERTDPGARVIATAGGRVVGIISPSDLARVVERRSVTGPVRREAEGATR